ncbi:unnamed protein product [Bursaphelenchus xylophilus]|uniref:(pine wood nematode) hypothetical protein n=1 Tax=Bursaphelenchus xylophilus TaxID=6326 RepID=A0A7I8WNS6_BURXY|nr:unnamed protein product [Bursaphelenchus xylophilus]CAG9093789.1 unnamed protein product [Bursaphelenchus xylophilus]
MLVSLVSLLINWRTKKGPASPEDYYKCVYGFHVHKATFVLSLLYLTASALLTGTLMHMAQNDFVVISKGVEIMSYILLICGNHFDIPWLYMPYMIVFLIYAAYLYLTAFQIIGPGNGLMEHWDQFRAVPEQALQASISLFSQTLSGIYVLWIVFRSWQYLRLKLRKVQEFKEELKADKLAIKNE